MIDNTPRFHPIGRASNRFASGVEANLDGSPPSTASTQPQQPQFTYDDNGALLYREAGYITIAIINLQAPGARVVQRRGFEELKSERAEGSWR